MVRSVPNFTAMYSESELRVNPLIFHTGRSGNLRNADNAGMTRAKNNNQIKRIRQLRGLTSEALADLVGITQAHVSRIENRTRGLSLALAEKFAMALKTDVEDVIGSKAGIAAPSIPQGFEDDVVPYTHAADDISVISPRQRQNIDEWTVRSKALSNLDLVPGMTVYVDISAAAVDNVPPLAMVIAQAYLPGTMEAKTLLRQFVPPSLLITNSAEENAPTIDMNVQDAHIKGVIVEVRKRVARQ